MRDLSIFLSTASRILLVIIAFTQPALARDLTGSVQSLGGDVKNILMVVGPVMLMVTGGFFYFSRQMGLTMLVQALFGTVIFAASGTIFMMLFRAFN